MPMMTTMVVMITVLVTGMTAAINKGSDADDEHNDNDNDNNNDNGNDNDNHHDNDSNSDNNNSPDNGTVISAADVRQPQQTCCLLMWPPCSLARAVKVALIWRRCAGLCPGKWSASSLHSDRNRSRRALL